MHRDCIFNITAGQDGHMTAKRSPAYLTEFPIIIVGHSGQMTTEAFGRLASWSSFNIVVGRHDEFAHSELPSHKSVGQQLSQSFYIFPIPHTQTGNPGKTPFLPHRHSHYPRGRRTPRKNRQKHA